MIKNSQKGVSLYFAVAVSALLMSIALGLTTILIGQIRVLKEMGDSVKALFAADSGMEKIMYLEKECAQAGCATAWPGICNASCSGFLNWQAATSVWFALDYTATATAASTSGKTIFRATGVYRGAQRAIEAAR